VKILVTGGEGQLATAFAAQATQSIAIELVALGRSELDIGRPEAIESAIQSHRPDVVINTAAFTDVDGAEDEPDLAWSINAAAPGEIARQSLRVGARLIHISTDYVFDGASDVPYDEAQPTNPLNIYGQTKLAGEVAVRAATPDHLIVRTAWLYSPFRRNFVTTMIALAANRDRIRVVADERGNPSSAADVAAGLLTVIERWRRGGSSGLGSTFHLAGSGEATRAGLAEAVFESCRELGLPSAEVEPIASADWPAKARRPRHSMLDCGRFETEFGYRAPDWRTSLRTVIESLRTESAHKPGP
jgi:dTDP-4-dehydrorhamnose reductase